MIECSVPNDYCYGTVTCSDYYFDLIDDCSNITLITTVILSDNQYNR